MNLDNLPKVAEYGSELARAYPSQRETLEEGLCTWANGACWCDLALVHRTAGYTPAGSAMRLDGEAWGSLRTMRDGTRLGQWFANEEEARADFNKRNSQ